MYELVNNGHLQSGVSIRQCVAHDSAQGRSNDGRGWSHQGTANSSEHRAREAVVYGIANPA